MANQEQLPELPEPYEYLDLEDGHSISLNINKAELGLATIHPRNPSPRHVRQYMEQRGLSDPPAPGTPISVRVPVLRVHGFRLDEPSPTTYWDISARTLQADLGPRVLAPHQNAIVVVITAHGYKPHKRYSVEV